MTDSTSQVIYLWLLPNLIDPASRPHPLASYVPGRWFLWAPGCNPELPAPMYPPETAVGSIIQDLPMLVGLGVRYNATGMGAGNIREGAPFQVADLLPGIRRLLTQVRSHPDRTPEDPPFAWEPHGAGYALYLGREDLAHGLNLLTVTDHYAWDSNAQALRDLIAGTLNMALLLAHTPVPEPTSPNPPEPRVDLLPPGGFVAPMPPATVSWVLLSALDGKVTGAGPFEPRAPLEAPPEAPPEADSFNIVAEPPQGIPMTLPRARPSLEECFLQIERLTQQVAALEDAFQAYQKSPPASTPASTSLGPDLAGLVAPPDPELVRLGKMIPPGWHIGNLLNDIVPRDSVVQDTHTREWIRWFEGKAIRRGTLEEVTRD